MTEFTRKELQGIIRKAERMTNEVLNPLWKRACERLVDAAWALDVIMARTEEK